MKKTLLILGIFISVIHFSHGQNAIVGTGFTLGWGGGSCPTTGNGNFTTFSANVASTYGSAALTPNGTGNQYWRFGIEWGGTTAHRTITPGSDVAVSPGTKYTLNSSCTTSGAMYYNVPNTGYRYIFKTLDAGITPTGVFVFFQIQGSNVRTISNVSQSPLQPISGDSVVITATTSGAFEIGQSAYLRYSTDNFSTSTVVEMQGSGTTYQAAIPRTANVHGSPVAYYLFTSGSGLTIAPADADLYTINLNNNGNANYSYTPGFYSFTPTVPTGNQSVTLTLGTAGTGFSALPADQEVYAHLGAVLQGAASTTWDVIKGNWGQGDGIGEFSQINSHQWALTFQPNLYFATTSPNNNAGNENPDFEQDVFEFDSTAHSIFRLGLVFRSTTGAIVVKDNGYDTGGDIYHDIDPGYWLLMDPPRLTNIVDIDLANDPINYTVSGTVSVSSTITIRLNDDPTPIYTISSTAFNHSIDLAALGFGVHKVEVHATDGTDTKVFTRLLNVYDSDQLVVLNSSLYPSLPTATTEVTLTFNATNTTLEGASKVYLHSAAVTGGPTSEIWSNTIGNWGQDDGVGEMDETAPGSNIWTITFTPSAYYFPNTPLDPNDNIFRLAMVFRNAEGTIQQKGRDGNDIYINIDPGFYLLLQSPAGNTPVVQQNATFSIQASSSALANYQVSINSPTPYSNSTNNVSSIDLDTSIDTPGTYTISVSATDGVTTKTKTKSFGIYSGIVSENFSPGLKYGPNYNNNDPTKATLLVHLPTQGPVEVVHVIGDFNNWTVSENYKMKRNVAGDVWWLELTNLVPGREYIYQYLLNGTIKAGDPYSEKISDPDDQYISSSRYPGLIAYPFGKTEFRASVLQTDQEEYVWQVPNFERPELFKANMYELLIRDFTDEGTYEAAIGKLDYIKSLGFNSIHLMPTSEFEGNESWGYNPNYYFAPDKFYGPKNKLKKLVDEAHKRGIAIIGDLVLNHSFYSSPFARFYWNDGEATGAYCSPIPRPRADNPWFNECHNFVDERAAWWGADFNHNSTHTQALVDSINDYWMTEYKFDGFRFDFTKGFSNSPVTCPDCWGSNYDQTRIDNLLRMKNELESRHPGAYVIFEHLANPDEDRVLANAGVHMWGGAGITKRYENIVLGYSDTNRDLTNGVYSAGPFYFGVSNLMSYMESHDEERLGFEIAQYGRQYIRDEMNAGARNWDNPLEDFSGDLTSYIQRLRLAASINLLLPGARMVWQFGELGYDYSINFSGRTGNKPIRWDYYNNAQRKTLHDFYSKVLNLRKNHEVFHHLDAYDLSNWVKWMRFEHNGAKVVVLANFQSWKSGDSQNNGQVEYFDVQLDDIFEGCGGNWHEVILDEVHNLTIPGTYRLNAGDVRIYANIDLNSPPSGNSTVGDVGWLVDWDDTNLVITTIGMAMDEAAVVYIDHDPAYPVNGGNNSNGTLVGFNYDGATINPSFRADFVSYVKNNYRESRTKNNSNGWTDATNRTATWTYEESNCALKRVITIPWVDITGGGKPDNFNWAGYMVYNNANTGTYGGQPNFGGYEANYGLSGSGPYTRNNVRYFNVSTTGTEKNPFDKTSYSHDGATLSGFGNFDIEDFTMNNGGSITITNGITWNVDGDIYIGPGASLTTGNSTIYFSGTSLDLLGTMNNSAGTMVITGASPVEMNGNFIFNNLVINNPAGVTLNGTVTINGQLTLQNGKITTTNTHLLTINENGSINTTIGNGSYIDGPLRKVGNSDFYFPVGAGNTFAPIALEEMADGANTDHFTIQYFATGYGQPEDRLVMEANKIPDVFQKISSLEYWNVVRSDGSNLKSKVRLYVPNLTRSDVTDISRIVVAHYDGANWETKGGTGASFLGSRTSVLSDSLFDSYSPITLGGPVDQPLPVELVSFSATNDGFKNILRWKTASEVDNSHFEVLMAYQDGTFAKIAEVTGANLPFGAEYNFNHIHQGPGLYYYKLKQVDFDGAYEYSPITVAYVKESGEQYMKWSIYPNPVENKMLNLAYPGTLLPGSLVNVHLIDLSGKSIYQQEFRHQDQHTAYTVRLPEALRPGMYVVKINALEQSWQSNILVR